MTTDSSLDSILFYCFAALALAGGLGAVSMRNAVHCALSLITSLLGVAGLFLLQQAEFLFAAQIILYVGGIMVLFLFAIMLIHLEEAQRQRQVGRSWPWAVGILTMTAAIGAGVVIRYRGYEWPRMPEIEAVSGGNVQALGALLLSRYLLPFEIISFLLLAAIVGSVYLARRKA
jgi:NADH-quinone oxidoreductase subunit J